MGRPSLLIVVGVVGTAVGSLSGCARDFHAQLEKPAPVVVTRAGDEARPADPAQTWSTGSCLHTMEKIAVERLERSPASDLAGRVARRSVTTRLVELQAPALLAAPDHALRLLAGPGRPYRLCLRRGAGPGSVDPSRLVALNPADRFHVTGVPGFSHTPGEGTPLVGTLRPTLPVSCPGLVTASPVSGLTWAVTAVPRFDLPGGLPTVTLELYDPHTVGQVARPDGGSDPLAADYTTPLAVAVTRFQPQRRGLLGLVRGSDYFPASGLFASEKPTPLKTPLVLVHGLISDPTDFATFANYLNTSPEVRRRYQVWVFYYPTSLPVAYAAMLLREDLEQFIQQLDPDGTRSALHRAVLVGHSMGGLLCRFAVSDGGDRYYHHFFHQPVDALQLSAPDRQLVRRTFYYRASPDVAQVVFIATPHRGSRLAVGPLGSLGRLLLHMPAAVRLRLQYILARNPTTIASKGRLRPGSSLDSLTPRAPAIAAVNEMPLRPGVRLHSVLGDRGRGGPRELSGDGVVPYASGHLPQAESEIIVPASHTGILKRPETAGEVIRILRRSVAPGVLSSGEPRTQRRPVGQPVPGALGDGPALEVGNRPEGAENQFPGG